MKRNVCVMTATRAEWGLLRPVAEKIREKEGLRLVLAVTGTHFLAEYGNTHEEIVADGFAIDERVDIQLYPQSPAAVSKTAALAVAGFADLFARRRIDLLIVLGDRYETLAVSMAAMCARVPIAHLHGGETTEGAMDEGIRHAVTKLASLHFTSNESHRRRVIQMGERPGRVFNTGAPGIDNILGMELLPKDRLSGALGFDLDGPYGVVTFHPATLEGDAKRQCGALFQALSAFPKLRFVITKSNADEGGNIINAMIDEYAAGKANVLAAASLGSLKYLSALKHAAVMVGNSSSGIIEAPYFQIPVVNIGERQKGRMQNEGTLNCPAETGAIAAAMRRALAPGFKEGLRAQNLYGDGNAARRIADIVGEELRGGPIDLKKSFYDLDLTLGTDEA